jgi:hypothetical protein
MKKPSLFNSRSHLGHSPPLTSRSHLGHSPPINQPIRLPRLTSV